MVDVTRVRRILLAVTETSPLEKLWQSVIESAAGTPAEIVAVIISDDSWHRAASLPFTIEISRVSGSPMAFTRLRAERIGREAAGRVRQRLEQLAAGTQLRLVFEVLPGTESAQASRVSDIERDLLIAPSVLEGQPILAELTRRYRQVLLVEAADGDATG